MKIKIGQNQYGRFNITGTKKETAFNIKIVDDNGDIIEDEDGNKAIAKFKDRNKEDRTDEFKRSFENGDIYYLYEECRESQEAVWSTSQKETLNNLQFFKETFNENREELKENFKQKRMKRLKKIKFNKIL